MSLVNQVQTLTCSREIDVNASAAIIVSDDEMTEEDEEQGEYEKRIYMYRPQQTDFSSMTDENPAIATINADDKRSLIEEKPSSSVQIHRYQTSILFQKPQQRGKASPSGETSSTSLESIYTGSIISKSERKRKYEAGKENSVLDGKTIVSTKRLKGDFVERNSPKMASKTQTKDRPSAMIRKEQSLLSVQAPETASLNQVPTTLSTTELLPVSTGPSRNVTEMEPLGSLSFVSQASKKAKQGDPSKNSKKLTKKEQEKLDKERLRREKDMTYARFIDYLPQKVTQEARCRYPQIFQGIVILLARHMGERKPHIKGLLEIMALHGARLVTRYTKEVTHIVLYQVPPEQEKTPEPVIGVPVSCIPLRVKIVWGRWLSRCQAKKQLLDVCMEDHVFWDRFHAEQSGGGPIDATKLATKRQRKEDPLDSEDEEINQKRALKAHKSKGLITVAQQQGPTLSSNSVRQDPTDEFLLAAANMNSEDEEDSDNGTRKGKYSNFQCMQKGGPLLKRQNPNQDIIEELQKLANIHAGQLGDETPWKERTLVKAIGSLRRHPTRIETLEEAMLLYGIGRKTGEKIMEIIETGKLKRIEYETSELDVASNLFQGIYGVGRQLGYDWSRLGLRSLDDVRQRKGGIKLTPAQELGLQYYDDINTRMPRQEAKDIFDKIHRIALSIDAKLSLELMGSFRRGRETCGDIDILITRDPSDGHDHATLHVLPILLRQLHEENIIVADLGGEDNDELEAKYMGLCRRSPEDKVRRIDILTIPFEQWGAALVYFTGDDIFNRSMRLLANKKGMSLNQRGLWEGVIRDPKTRQKTAVGRIIASRTEQEIFRALGVPWQEPHERIRS